MAIGVSEKAADKIRDILRKEGATDGGLRIGVKGGGLLGSELCHAV